jgi:hypothetical protein
VPRTFLFAHESSFPARAGSYGSDKHAIAKIDRVSEAEEAFRRRLLAKADPDIDAPARPRSRIPSRGFSRFLRPLRSRSTFQKQKDEFNAE